MISNGFFYFSISIYVAKQNGVWFLKSGMSYYSMNITSTSSCLYLQRYHLKVLFGPAVMVCVVRLILMHSNPNDHPEYSGKSSVLFPRMHPQHEPRCKNQNTSFIHIQLV